MSRVLIVDDAAFMRLSIRSILEKNGFSIAGEADDGAEGLKKYKELRPDIVTLDITMPSMSGIEALSAIVEFDPGARVVMVTAMGQESLVKEAVLSGAKSFIVKPFKAEHIVQTLKTVLST